MGEGENIARVGFGHSAKEVGTKGEGAGVDGQRIGVDGNGLGVDGKGGLTMMSSTVSAVGKSTCARVRKQVRCCDTHKPRLVP